MTRASLPWAVLVVLVAAPLGGLAGVLVLDSRVPPALEPAVEPIVVAPTAQRDDGARAVAMRLTLGSPESVRSAGASGLVTGVSVHPGETVGIGDVVYSVDGVPRLAVGGPAPLHRPLSEGARGPDVLVVEELLVATGHLDEAPDTQFSGATTAALRTYAAEVGLSPATSVFSPDLVVWLPTDDVVVGSIDVAPGQPSPGQGEPLLLGLPSVVDAVLTDADGGPLRLDEPVLLRVGDRELGTVTDPRRLPRAVIDAVKDAIRSSAALDETGSADAREGTIAATIRFESPREELVVPSTAVMTTRAGDGFCVWLDGPSGFDPIAVDVVGGELGRTSLSGLDAGSRVLANPIPVLDDAQCPSP